MKNDVHMVLKVLQICMPVKKFLHLKKPDANYMLFL